MSHTQVPRGFGFLALGVGDAFSKRFYASSMLVGFEDEWIVIDCPHPQRKMLHEASASAGFDLDWDILKAVVLTHLHADHCSGVESYLYYCRHRLRTKPVLIAHDDVSARLWSGHLSAGMGRVETLENGTERSRSLDDFATLLSIPGEGELEFGSFSIACRKTLHTVPTTALRIRAGGRCLGYSSDTSFDPALIDWLSEADLIVHETNLGIHTDYRLLCGLPRSLRERIKLVHYPDEFEADDSAMELLREGQWYSV